MSSVKKIVAYVGPYSFPEGGAAARRIYGNCITLARAGYDVIVTTGEVANGVDVEEKYHGIRVVPLGERRYEHLPRILKHMMYFSAGIKTINWLESLETKPDAIVLYSGYSPYLLRLLPWARRNNVKLIFDTVEWYDPPSLAAKLFSPYFLNIELAMRCLLKKCDGLIVISDYLHDYYEGSVKNIAQIPPTVDCNDMFPRTTSGDEGVIKLVYAGTPGKKDSLSSIIEAVLKVFSNGVSIELHLAGIEKSDLVHYTSSSDPDFKNLDSCIKCHGLLSHGDALRLVRDCDYSVILRPNIRSVQAGFPTKFVESLALGTPVIANLTSDMGRYLVDGYNGFVCEDSSVESLVKVIGSCFDVNNYGVMRVQARETAEKHFDVHNYIFTLKRLLNNV